jgi:hypothetical protein
MPVRPEWLSGLIIAFGALVQRRCFPSMWKYGYSVFRHRRRLVEAKRRDRIIAAKSDFWNDFRVFPGSSDLCAALMDGCPF